MGLAANLHMLKGNKQREACLHEVERAGSPTIEGVMCWTVKLVLTFLQAVHK